MSSIFRPTRRGFMVGCSAAIAAMAGSRLTNLAFASPEKMETAGVDTLVVIFLRGGWDALNAVPVIEGPDRLEYKNNLRKTLYVPTEAEARALGNNIPGAIPLAGSIFGLHPGLAPLADLYSNKSLAVVHAVGLNNDTRSHFDAQQYIETGTPGAKTSGTGWLTRHLNAIGSSALPTDITAVAAGGAPAMSLLGDESAITISGTSGFDFGVGGTYNNQFGQLLSDLYTGTNWLHGAGTETLSAIASIQSKLQSNTIDNYALAGYEQYNYFHDQLKSLAKLIKTRVGMRAATLDLGGWDTHESQQNGGGDARGYLLNQLDDLARGLKAFYTDLSATGDQNRTTIMVMSEFGRRAKENDNRGTDHGHGSAMLVLGGYVNGGKVHGAWPGLSNDQLYDHADLAVSTDYRTVISEALAQRAGNTDVAQVFPGFVKPADLGLFKTAPSKGISVNNVYLPMARR